MRRPILWMAVTALLCVSSIRADIVYNFGDTFSGTSPAGTAPWLTATFHTVSTGTVTLTLNSQLQSSTEFISDVYFNTNPAGLVPASLAFAQNSGVSFSGATLGEDCCKADGDGYYDIEIDFPTSQGSRFGQGSSAVFTFTGTGITEDYFDFLSSPGGGSGPFDAAAHVQGIQRSLSGWIDPSSDPATVPEPTSVVLLLSVMGGLGFALQRHRAR